MTFLLSRRPGIDVDVKVEAEAEALGAEGGVVPLSLPTKTVATESLSKKTVQIN